MKKAPMERHVSSISNLLKMFSGSLYGLYKKGEEGEEDNLEEIATANEKDSLSQTLMSSPTKELLNQ